MFAMSFEMTSLTGTWEISGTVNRQLVNVRNVDARDQNWSHL